MIGSRTVYSLALQSSPERVSCMVNRSHHVVFTFIRSWMRIKLYAFVEHCHRSPRGRPLASTRKLSSMSDFATATRNHKEITTQSRLSRSAIAGCNRTHHDKTRLEVHNKTHLESQRLLYPQETMRSGKTMEGAPLSMRRNRGRGGILR